MKFNSIIILASFFISSNLRSQSGFLPSDLAGLSLWLTGDSVSLSSGNNIDTCYDLSPNLNHAKQSIINAQPKKITSALNGHHVMRFDTLDDFVDDYIKFNSINDIRTVFWVIREDTNASSKYRSLLGHTGNFDFIRGDNKELWNSAYTNTAIKTGQTKLNFASINGTSTLLPKNYAILSLVSTGVVSADNFSSDRGISGRYWYGDLAELVIYNQALTPAQTIQVEQYLNNKYAPPISLPGNISILNSLCDTTLVPSGSFKNYQWSTGATTPTISVATSGKYWVTATNIFGKVSADTIYVTYPPIHTISNSVFCAGDSLQWDTQLPSSDFTFLWQDGITTDSVYQIKQAGKYYVKINDLFGCSVTLDTVKITIDNFPVTTSLGPDASLCAGNFITLTNGTSPSLTYTWSTSSNNDSLLIDTTGQYSVVVTNTNNCVARDTIIITINGQAPVANYSNSIGCQNTVVSFTNLSVPPSGNTFTSTTWSFGDPLSGSANSSTSSNPIHTFSATGTYTVLLNVITDVGCTQTIRKTINIFPTPTTSFSIGNSCQNDNTAFSNLSTSIAGYSITSLNWNFGDTGSPANTSTLPNPTHTFTNQTTYTVSLTATNNAGCSSILSNTIAVKPQVKADFTYSTPCTNTTTIFQDNSIASSTLATSRSWNFGGPPFSGLTVPKTYTATGPYNVSLTVTVNGCTSTINKIITIFSPPLVSFTIPDFCSKDTITAINTSVAQSGAISSYNWRVNNNSFSSVQNPTLSLATAGNYPVRLTVANSFGCKDSLTKTFTVNPLPVVDFTTNPANYYYINEPIGFIPSFTNAASYVWNVAGVTTSTLQNPSVTLNSEGTYTVSLILQAQQGCKNSKTKTLLVSKRYLDLAILNVTTVKDDDGFMTVVADIANYGTVPATTMNLQYQISDGGNNKESWTGVLNPNSYFSYTFNSKSASQENSSNNITCVAIKKVNGIDDGNQNNNDLCSALYYDEISVSNPFPNPTAENLTLPVILNKDIDFTLSIYTSTGQILFEETTQKGLMGLNLVSIPTSSYAWGCYIIKVVVDDKLFIKKFIKVNN